MDKSMIKRHNFEVSKKNIETFSKNLPSNPAFDRVEVNGGFFGWGDHTVTGTEMNNFIDKVQDKLISVNKSLTSIISEFREVYKAFDYLDDEYIKGIIGSIESAEEASKQALKAQSDIQNTVENLKKTVWGLVDLKDSVERILCQVNSFIEKSNQTTERINNDISALQQYRTLLETYHHLGDVDAIWNDVESHKTSITKMQDQINHFISEVHTTTNEIKESIKSFEKANTDAHLQYERKIRTAYYISGSAIGLSIINYLLQILGII